MFQMAVALPGLCKVKKNLVLPDSGKFLGGGQVVASWFPAGPAKI